MFSKQHRSPAPPPKHDPLPTPTQFLKKSNYTQCGSNSAVNSLLFFLNFICISHLDTPFRVRMKYGLYKRSFEMQIEFFI